MKKTNKKTVIFLFVLFLIFIFTLVRALKPVKPKTIVIAPEGSNQQIVQQSEVSSKNKDEIFDIQQIDMSINRLQTIVKNIEEQQMQTIVIEPGKNPFRYPEKGTTENHQISTGSILRQDYVSVPDFKISGIVYDKEKPMVIIDNEVKVENEIKSGYMIYKILADRVILKKENREFVIYASSSGANNMFNETNISETMDIPVKEILATENEKYRTILKESEEYKIAKKSSIKEPQARIELKNEKTDRDEIKFSSDSEKRIYKILTVQVASFGKNKKQQAIEFARMLSSEGYKNVRVENINGMYTVRTGMSEEKDELVLLCESLKQYSETSFVRKAFLIQERIIYPPIEQLTFNL